MPTASLTGNKNILTRSDVFNKNLNHKLGRGGGVDAAAVAQRIIQIRRRWRSCPDIVVLQRQEELPPAIARQAPAGRGIRAAIYQERVYVVADNLGSMAEVDEAVLHEVVGHWGARAFGREWSRFVNDVSMRLGNDKLTQIAADGGFDLGSPAGRQRAAEEYLAGLAERAVEPGLARRIVARFKLMLRRCGMRVTLNDQDALALLHSAVRQRGGKGAVYVDQITAGPVRASYSLSDAKGGAGRDTAGAAGGGLFEFYRAQGRLLPRSLRAVLKAEVNQVATGIFKAPAKVATPEAVAGVLRPLARKAQEHFVALVTDKDHRPLAVIRHSVGTTRRSQVEYGVLLGSLLDIPGAEHVWFAHNHPGGNAVLSVDDQQTYHDLAGLLDGTGAKPMGLLALTASGKAGYMSGEARGVIDAAKPGGKEVSALEREHDDERDTGQAIGSFEDLKAAMNSHEGEGVLLLDAGNHPLGWVPMGADEMVKLRTGDSESGAGLLMRAIHRAGAALIAPKIAGHSQPALANLNRFSQAAGVYLLDAAYDGKSAVAEGEMALLRADRGPYFSLAHENEAAATELIKQNNPQTAGSDLTVNPRMPRSAIADVLHNLGIKDKDPDGVTITIKDYRDIYKFLQLPSDIALTHPEFSATYQVQRTREANKATLDAFFAQKLKPYFELGRDYRQAVDIALLEGEKQNSDQLDDAELKRIGLNNNQIDAYKAVRTSLGTAREMLFENMEEIGVDEKTLEDFKKSVTGYVPHKWYGDWAVVVKDKDGQTVYMQACGRRERYRTRDTLAKHYARDKGYRITVIERSKIPYEAYQEASPAAIRKMLDLAAEKAGVMNEDVAGAIKESLKELYKEKGFGAHFIKRGGIEGYSEDLARPLADYFSGLTGYLTKMVAMREFSQSVTAINMQRKPALYKYALDYIRYVTGQQNEHVWIKRAAYYWFLYGNIKSTAINLTQGLLVSWPTLAGVTGTPLRRLMDGQRALATGNVTEDERAWMKRLEARGYLDAQLAAEISAYKGNPLFADLKSKTGAVVSMLDIFRKSEEFNRRSMALALYRSGVTKVDEAGGLVEKCCFRLTKGNRPVLARGHAAPIMTFRLFTVNYVTWMKNEAKAGNWGSLGLSMAILLLLSGLTGLPGYQQLEALIHRLIGGDLENEAHAALGSRIARIVMRGLPAGGGVYLGGSVGMGQILPDPTDVKDVLGVAYSLYDKPALAIKDAGSGDFYRALEDLAPEAVRNPMAAWRLYSRGNTSRSGAPLLDPLTGKQQNLTAGEAWMKGLGFQPIRASERSHITESLLRDATERSEMMMDYATRIRVATSKGDLETRKAVIDEIKKHNVAAIHDGHPENAITRRQVINAMRNLPGNRPDRRERITLGRIRAAY